MEYDVVTLDDVPIVYAAAGSWDSIPAAAAESFGALEAAIPPPGRTMYGYWHPPALEYRACYAREDGDDAEALALQEGLVPGGRYARVRLHGDNAFAKIGPSFDALAAAVPPADDGRPWLEFYRRHDEVDVLIPIATAAPPP